MLRSWNKRVPVRGREGLERKRKRREGEGRRWKRKVGEGKGGEERVS